MAGRRGSGGDETRQAAGRVEGPHRAVAHWLVRSGRLVMISCAFCPCVLVCFLPFADGLFKDGARGLGDLPKLSKWIVSSHH